MGYFSTYKNYLKLNNDSSIEDLILNNKITVENNFDNFLITETVLIDDIEYEVAYKQEKKSEDKKLILKPDIKVNIGSIAEIKNHYYLVTDFLGEGIYEVYPTATLKRCNETFILTIKGQRVIAGYDDFKRPIYEDTPPTNHYFPCVLTDKIYSTVDNSPIPLPDGAIMIKIPYKTNQVPPINYEFRIHGNMYKITTISYENVINGVGFLEIRMQRMTGGVS